MKLNKRDHFAALAMQALISKMPFIVVDKDDEEVDTIYNMIARSAYYYADNMIFIGEEE